MRCLRGVGLPSETGESSSRMRGKEMEGKGWLCRWLWVLVRGILWCTGSEKREWQRWARGELGSQEPWTIKPGMDINKESQQTINKEHLGLHSNPLLDHKWSSSTNHLAQRRMTWRAGCLHTCLGTLWHSPDAEREGILKWPGVKLKRIASKKSACNAGGLGSIPGLGGSPGKGSGNPLQYSCLGSPMDRGAWRAAVHGIARVRHDLVTKPPPPQYRYKLHTCFLYSAVEDRVIPAMLCQVL